MIFSPNKCSIKIVNTGSRFEFYEKNLEFKNVTASALIKGIQNNSEQITLNME